MSKKTSPPTPPARTQVPPRRRGGLYVDGARVEPETTGKTHTEIEEERQKKRAKARAARRSDPMPGEAEEASMTTDVAQTADTQPEVSDAPSDPD